MRSLVLLASCCIVLIVANEKKPADKEYIQKQKQILELLIIPNQPEYNPELAQVGQQYNPRDNAADFTNSRAVKNFINAEKRGFLPRNEAFSPSNSQQLEQMVTVFDFFYFAKDFNAFYKAASYIRLHVNPYIYEFAFRAAVRSREDTKAFYLPPLADTYPFFFADSQAIQQAQYYKEQGKKQGTFYRNYTGYQQAQQHQSEQHHDENAHFPFEYESSQQYENYYSQYNSENRLSYYTDDVQLNQFNVEYYLMNLPFFNRQKYGAKNQDAFSGEEFYYYLQQSLARYNLERSSNNMPSVRPISFDRPITPGYNPNTVLRNGEPVPVRPNNVPFNNANSYYLTKLKDVERRLRDAVDSEYAVGADGSKVHLTAENGIDLLGKAVAGSFESVNKEYYSVQKGDYGFVGYFQLFLQTVGHIADPYYQKGVAPGALEYFGTAIRDPLYYQIVARVVNLFQSFKNKIEPYGRQQIEYPEVKVESVEVDELYTYVDTRDVDLQGAVQYQKGEQAENYDYRARHYELNHKPFTYKINVQSTNDRQAVFRVFVGPKYNANGQLYTLEQARKYFVEFDRFVYQLKNGQNKVERNSQQSGIFVEDQKNTRTLFREIQEGQISYYENPNEYIGFPQNLLLPKGNRAGQEFTFFVIVNEYQPRPNYQGQSYYPYVDNKPFGFPFDRRVHEEYFENAPNAFFKTVKIYNKYKSEVNSQ